jgi:transcription antitermination factor NusG
MIVPSAIEEQQWYAVQTRSRFEKIARAELEGQHIEHYLPAYEELHQWKDRKKNVEMPLFSGYLFARFHNSEKTRLRVLRTTGVVRILGTGGVIEAVPNWQVTSIRQLLVSGIRPFTHPFICEGAWVRVRRGALAGVEGRLIRLKNQARLILSIDLLSQSVATEVDARDVEPAPERQPRKY